MTCKLGTQSLVGLVLVKAAVVFEKYDVFGIDKVIAEILGKNKSVDIFAAAGGKIASGMMQQSVFDVLELSAKIKAHAELGDYIFKSLDNFLICCGYIAARACFLITAVQQICHLNILGEALARCRGDDKPT